MEMLGKQVESLSRGMGQVIQAVEGKAASPMQIEPVSKRRERSTVASPDKPAPNSSRKGGQSQAAKEDASARSPNSKKQASERGGEGSVL